MGSQRVGHYWATDLIWSECVHVHTKPPNYPFPHPSPGNHKFILSLNPSLLLWQFLCFILGLFTSIIPLICDFRFYLSGAIILKPLVTQTWYTWCACHPLILFAVSDIWLLLTSSVVRLSPVCMKLILVIFFFFFPWFCIFPYGLFPYFKPWSSGILIYAFSLGSQSNIHSLTSPKSVTTSDHASPSTIPAGILSVTVSNSLLNSSASCHTSPLWPWTCSEMDLTILVHNPGSFSGVSIFVIGKRAEPQHYL